MHFPNWLQCFQKLAKASAVNLDSFLNTLTLLLGAVTQGWVWQDMKTERERADGGRSEARIRRRIEWWLTGRDEEIFSPFCISPCQSPSHSIIYNFLRGTLHSYHYYHFTDGKLTAQKIRHPCPKSSIWSVPGPGYEPSLMNSAASGVPSNLCGSSTINLKYNCSSHSSLPLSGRS